MMPTRFRAKLMLAALLPSVLLALVLTYLWLTWSQRALEDAMQQRMEAVAGQLASAAEFHIFTGDAGALHNLTSAALERDRDLVTVAILDHQGRVLAHSGIRGRSVPVWPMTDAAKQSRISRPIHFSPLVLDDPFMAQPVATARAGNDLLGQVELVVSLENLNQQRDRQLLLGLAAILLALLVAGLLAMYMAAWVTGPIRRIMQVVERIGQGEKNARVDPDPDSVLFQLEVGINRMAEKVAITQEDLQARVDAATVELTEQKQRAEQEARLDPLTGVANRRAFMERGDLELQRVGRYGGTLSLVILDLDFFKLVNDHHGHAAGDSVLVGVAEILLQCVREVDFVARLGGEEFVILMPDTDANEAERASERMRKAISALRVHVTSGAVSCTASFGVAEYSGDDIDIDMLTVHADRALYAAKSAGRDRVRVYGRGRDLLAEYDEVRSGQADQDRGEAGQDAACQFPAADAGGERGLE